MVRIILIYITYGFKTKKFQEVFIECENVYIYIFLLEKMSSPISPNNFYGRSLDNIYNDIDKRIEQMKHQKTVIYEDRQRTIFEPLPHKREFWKQCDALAEVAAYSQGEELLCCFVYQDEQERRRFIVSYPEDFWNEMQYCPPERRVFYEV